EFILPDVGDPFSTLTYFRDLIKFSKGRINTEFPNSAAQLKTRILDNALYQPFTKLNESLVPKANETVNQLRPVVETLRRFLADRTVNEGIIGQWTLTEGGGDIAYDSGGSGRFTNDGEIFGAIWGTGRIDNGLEFDGATTYVRVSNQLRATDLSFSKECT